MDKMSTLPTSWHDSEDLEKWDKIPNSKLMRGFRWIIRPKCGTWHKFREFYNKPHLFILHWMFKHVWIWPWNNTHQWFDCANCPWICTADKHICAYVLPLVRRGNALGTNKKNPNWKECLEFCNMSYVYKPSSVAGELTSVRDALRN